MKDEKHLKYPSGGLVSGCTARHSQVWSTAQRSDERDYRQAPSGAQEEGGQHVTENWYLDKFIDREAASGETGLLKL